LAVNRKKKTQKKKKRKRQRKKKNGKLDGDANREGVPAPHAAIVESSHPSADLEVDGKRMGNHLECEKSAQQKRRHVARAVERVGARE